MLHATTRKRICVRNQWEKYTKCVGGIGWKLAFSHFHDALNVKINAGENNAWSALETSI